MPWNSILVPERPVLEDILSASQEYQRIDSDFNGLRNWYSPAVDKLPLSVARIACQRSNVMWDSELRRKFIFWIRVLAALLFVLLLVFALIQGASVSIFLSNIGFPFLPALVLYLETFQNQRSIRFLTHLRVKADELWQRALSSTAGEVLDVPSRQLQDGLFLNRKSSPLIFNWFYERYRSSQDDLMNRSSQQLVEQYQNARRSS